MGKILVVDDDPVCREILGQILISASHEVITYDSGTSFLAGYKEHFSATSKPQAVFLDFMLGDMTGSDLLLEMKTNVDLSKTALIILSANSHYEMRVIEAEVQPDFFLEKPFIPSTVIDALNNHTKT